jgi:poly-gamma-glutamate synthesis protein (capsule biosynthesis protein)
VVARSLVLWLAGDVMTGRGVDQVLPSPGSPTLWERYVKDARQYVELAEAVNGRIARPAPVSWPWGDALQVIDDFAPDVRVINLETSVTARGERDPRKGIHYRMSPGNVGCLTVARPDACVLANNHVLDFGVVGLEETLVTLTGAGLRGVGAGRSSDLAWRPLVLDADGGRVLIWSVAVESSGVPVAWAADERHPGVAFLPDLSDASVARVVGLVTSVRRPGDLAIVSVHWGSNWGYEVPRSQRRFAHQLIDHGVDLVHGHSSHHPRPIEVYRDRLVLYGCGDLVNDYEGISGYERYRDDLRLLYFAEYDADRQQLQELRMVTMQARQLRLHRASAVDVSWLGGTLDRISEPFGSRVALGPDGVLALR